jgi:hypothetical protein
LPARQQEVPVTTSLFRSDKTRPADCAVYDHRPKRSLLSLLAE